MDPPSTLPINEVSYRRFEGDSIPLSDTDIPLRPENRQKTDKHFLFVLLGCIIVLLPFLFYILAYSDISRLKFHYHTNSKADDDSYHRDYRRSVTSEPDYELNNLGWKLTLASFSALGFTLIIAALFRYATGVVVWSILILSWSYFLVLTICLWMLADSSVFIKIIFTVITAGLLCVLIFMKDKIRLVTYLLKEATKATFDMQMVFSVPAVVIFLSLILGAGYATVSIFMDTAKESMAEGHGDYVSDDFVAGILIVNTIISYWVLEFILGVQYMIVSGAVVKWYFTRDKSLLSDPVYTSFIVTFKYHLGTVALGSLVITLVAVLRALLRSMTQNPRLRFLIVCCIDFIENILRFFTKNSYIVTAMHGTPFFKSGKQAVKLLTLNVCNTIAISSIGDFVIGMANVLIIGLSLLVSYFIFGPIDDISIFLCFLFVAVVALVCGCIILGTFETAFSTMFLCVCQDFLINNGSEKPYAMTRNMMEFLEESKKVFADKIQKKGLPTI